jgi:cell wall-associated NlpC family hydrolase
MQTALGAARKTPALRFFLALAVLAAALAAVAAPAGATTPGGLTTTTPEPEAPTGPETGPPGKAMLVDGRAIPPINAPPAVKQVIAAANKIRTKPYIWGGGHASFASTGYDCSGSVSFALHGGHFLESPLPSGPMESWGEEGPGRWITVWANAGHAYAEIAGYRWDTSGDEGGETGPRWHAELRDNIGFVARHPAGY